MLSADSSRKNELYQLIRNMDSQERGLYKKSRPPGARLPLHLHLFHLIGQSPVNDEKQFIRKLGIGSASHFSGLKARLWQDLLAFLADRRRKDADPGAYQAAEIALLLEKNMTGAAERLLDAAWSDALQQENYDLQLQLIRLRYQALSYSDHKYYQKQNRQLQEQQEQALSGFRLEQLLYMSARELVAFKQFSYMRLDSGQQDRVQAIEKDMQQITLPAGSPLLNMIATFNRCAIAHLDFRFRPAQELAFSLLASWQQYPGYIARHADLFLNCADYSFYNAFALKDVKAAGFFLAQYAIPAAQYLPAGSRSQWEILAFNTQLKIYHKRAEYAHVEQLIRERGKDILARIYQVLPPVQALSIVCSICISYFVLEQFDRAEDLLLDINEQNRNIQKEDVLYFTSVFYLLILLEKKSLLQLNHAISSAYFRLYNKKKLQPFEKDLMLFLKHVSNEYGEEARIRIIRNFLQQLDTYRNDPVKDLYFLFFNYYGWLESKTLKIPYTEYMRRQLGVAVS